MYPAPYDTIRDMIRFFLLFFAPLLLLLDTGLADPNKDSTLNLPHLVKNGSVLVERADGAPLITYRDNEQFVPASVLKVATAFCALENLGQSFRFETPFLTDHRGTLFIKGSGDPSLVSETLEDIAQEIHSRISRIERIVIDTSYYEDDLSIDGSAYSRNPYDAKNAAFVGNFSSVAATHTKKGEIISAEPQTPLTPLAKQAALRLPRGTTERINISSDWKVGVIYGGELLVAFLRKHGVEGAMRIQMGTVSKDAHEIYRHRSPKNLQEIIQSMLMYSTNFTANQIFLELGVRTEGAPATVSKGQHAMKECLTSVVGWQDFHVEEGSGLSRRNRVSAQQMSSLLKSFERYSFLLPEREGFIAKTGSLRGVNSLAGYFSIDGSPSPFRFVILINSEVPPLYKFTVANEIRNYIKNSRNYNK